MVEAINWTEALEAYHQDGRVVPVILDGDGPDNCGDYYTADVDGLELPTVWCPTGEPWLNVCFNEGWRIRNVSPAGAA